MKEIKRWVLGAISAVILSMSGYFLLSPEDSENSVSDNAPKTEESAGETDVQHAADTQESIHIFSEEEIPPYTGQPYVAVHNNIPYFSEEDLTDESFEYYSDLDELGRCGIAYASVGTDIMPQGERGSISHVEPTGWHTARYDVVDGRYLYNRCHLIGYQLSGENANKKNLITGTRYLNVQGMLPFENMVADYVKETQNHVLYRVTPVFIEDNLLASGVLMEAESVEDRGEGILFCVYVYNVQPGILIDYATGESRQKPAGEEIKETTYILNTKLKKFHYPSCTSVKQMEDSNKQEFKGNRDDLISQGYVPCKNCDP